MLCPEWDKATGGVRKLYRHVDVLSRHGVPAFISHHQQGFRYRWFENNTPVIYPPQCFPRTFDILVVPEIYAWEICNQTPGVPKVIYNQNAYQTFDNIPPELSDEPAPYTRDDVVGTIVVSQDNRRYLRHAFPNHLLYRIRHSIDFEVFRYERRKKLQIALMPRKLPYDATQVLSILEARGVLDGVGIVAIEDMTEAQTAVVFRESLVFLSFATEEGWSLPPMEAMACGCVVVGYDGRAAREYFTADTGFPVQADDIVRFAAAVEQVLTQARSDARPVLDLARRASEYVRSAYSRANEEQDILDAWRQILLTPTLPAVVS